MSGHRVWQVRIVLVSTIHRVMHVEYGNKALLLLQGWGGATTVCPLSVCVTGSVRGLESLEKP